MAKVIAVVNEKGGVGKTTAVVTIADILANWGHSVLVVDNDPQGHSTLSLYGTKEPLKGHVKALYNLRLAAPIHIKPGLDLIGANKLLGQELDKGFLMVYDFAESLSNYKKDYDYILIDSVPSTSYFLTATLLAAEYALVPLVAEPYAVDGLKEVLNTIALCKKPKFNPKLKIIGVFLNCVPGKETNITKGIIQGLRNVYRNLIFESFVSRGIAVVESITEQKTIAHYAPNHKLAGEFCAVTRELIMRIDEGFFPDTEQAVQPQEEEFA